MALTFAYPSRISGAEKIRRWSLLLQSASLNTLIANARVTHRGPDMRAAPGNTTYVTSLAIQYGHYPRDEIRLLPRFYRPLASLAFTSLRVGFPLRALGELWLLDNQPFSTALPPTDYRPSSPQPGEARRCQLTPAPPGTLSLPSRLVWLRPPGTPWTRDNHRDQRLEDASPGVWRALTSADFPHASALYDQLYRGKYSLHNPAFTPAFLQLLQLHEILDFQGLFIADQLVGVIGIYVVDGWLTTPVLGYDRSLPAAAGLYRRLCHRVLLISESAQLMLHRSAGAGAFKAQRGAHPQLEWIWLRPTAAPLRHHLLCTASYLSLKLARHYRL